MTTSIRFVGDLPIWIGIALTLVVGILSWRYYRRESFDLPGHLRWVLPLLRSLAFGLGILILTGPVLHHRTIIGELGKVNIYIDTSQSMTKLDPHMSTGRKLLVAQQLGWLEETNFDTTLLDLPSQLSTATERFQSQLEKPVESLSTAEIESARTAFIESLKSILEQLKNSPLSDSQAIANTIDEKIVQPLTMSSIDNDKLSESIKQLLTISSESSSAVSQIRQKAEQWLDREVVSVNAAIPPVLTQLDETPRWRRAALGLLDSPKNIFQELREHHDVNVYSLQNDEAVLLPELEDGTELSFDLFATQSNLSSGVIATQKKSSGEIDSEEQAVKTNTAVVLITDGQHNRGPSPLQTAEIMGNQGIAFYSIGTGAEQPAPDLAVVDVTYPDMVYQKDRVTGTIVLRDEMREGRPFTIQISHDNEVLWQKELITQNSHERRVDFEFTMSELVEQLGSDENSSVQRNAVPVTLQASIAALPEEAEVSNNQQVMHLAAITNNHKVLILDGRSRWETRYLRNVFERDEQWDIDTVIAGIGTDEDSLPRGTQRDQFPADRDELYEYDLIIFGEISRDLFVEHELEWLRDYAELRGGGIVFIDGARNRLKEYAQTPLGPLIPVEWLTDATPVKAVSLQLTTRGAQESALQLLPDSQDNQRFWTELPAPHSLIPVEAIPGAAILAEGTNSSGQAFPAIVLQRFGAGQVLYLAFDETWRWRYKTADTWHQRIWNQLAKLVMQRPFSVSNEYVALDTGPVSYDQGDNVAIRAKLMNQDGKPATGATVDALLWSGGNVVGTVSLTEDADVPGIYHGRSGAVEVGDYEVTIRAAGFADSVLQARTEFTVRPPASGEMQQTAANEALLQQIAQASEGVFLREEEMGKLPELLSPLSSGRVVESETLIWQSYWWFGAILALLTLEWILRKRVGLL